MTQSSTYILEKYWIFGTNLLQNAHSVCVFIVQSVCSEQEKWEWFRCHNWQFQFNFEVSLSQTFCRSPAGATRPLTMSVTPLTLGPGTRWRVFSSVRHSSTCICCSLTTWSCSVWRSTSSTQRPTLSQYGPLHPSDVTVRDLCKDQAHRVLSESKTVNAAQSGSSLSNRPDWTAVLSSRSVLSNCTLTCFLVEGFI